MSFRTTYKLFPASEIPDSKKATLKDSKAHINSFWSLLNGRKEAGKTILTQQLLSKRIITIVRQTWDRKVLGFRGPEENSLLDMTGQLCSGTRSRRGCLLKTCTRSSQSIFQPWGEGNPWAPTPSWRAVGRWLLEERGSVSFRCVSP